jgi:cyanophycinase-like exopeptidase
VTYSNLAEARSDVTLSMHNMTVHVLAEGNRFDLASRDPKPPGS